MKVRQNIEAREDGIYVCDGDHHRSDKCEYYQLSNDEIKEELYKLIKLESDQRKILSWCGSLEEAKLNGEFEIKDGVDSWFLRNVKIICQLATMDINKG